MTVIPPYLLKGDCIGIVCPAGYMAADRASECIRTLGGWGYRVKAGKTLGGTSDNYFSGTDDERLDDLQAMLDDDEVKAILCGRGGYGVSRIIDRLSFRKFRKKPKWIIGYSDISIVHAHVYANYRIASIHAPMAGAFAETLSPNPYIQSLGDALSGKPVHYEVPAHPFDRRGHAKGELLGGNLTLLAHIVGTPSDIKTKGKILFIEDIGEYVYNIDRLLYQLGRAGKLNRLAGLIVGSFTDGKDTIRPFGKTPYEIIDDILMEYDFPVCYGFPVGHTTQNFALKTGVRYDFTVGKQGAVLREI